MQHMEAFIQDQDIPHSIYEIEEQKIVRLNSDLFQRMQDLQGKMCLHIVPKNLLGYTQKMSK